MRGFREKIEELLAAVSFAEEGEFDAAQSFIHGGRRVLLALKEGHIDPKTFKYALNSAARINARLDVLYVRAPGAQPGSGDPLLRRFESELKDAGIAYRLAARSGCLKQEIIDYTNREREVLFVVVESPGSLDADCKKKDGVLTELWKNLRCPLVVVSDAAS